MKKTISTIINLMFSVLLLAQNENPYKQFGYQAPIMKDNIVQASNLSVMLIANPDTTSLYGFLTIDTKSRLIKIYSKEGAELLCDSILAYSTTRWLAPDPAGQFYSPYLGMGNNPINGTDPDGALFLIDDFVIGFAKGMFNSNETAWQSGVRHFTNSAEIWGGLFATDNTKSIGGQMWQVTSRFTWELPQTAMGFLTSHATNMIGNITDISYFAGATVSQTTGLWGGLTLGSYILGDMRIQANPKNILFQHEFGHYIQSQQFGLGYIPIFGIPSVISATKSAILQDFGHYYFYAETSANRKSLNYLQNHHNFSPNNWSNQNPLR